MELKKCLLELHKNLRAKKMVTEVDLESFSAKRCILLGYHGD